jgi:hypothetical protein
MENESTSFKRAKLKSDIYGQSITNQADHSLLSDGQKYLTGPIVKINAAT